MSGSPRCGLGNWPLNAAPLDFLLFICIHLQRFPLYMQARGVCVGGGTGNPGWAPLGEKPFPVGTPALASADALLKGAEQTHGNWQRAR